MVSKEVERLLLKVQKPGRYVGGELNEVVKNKNDVDVRFAFCFPDTYEVGMSHLGMKILYSRFNSVPYIWCERVFAPWVDMEEEMVKHGIPLYALESGDPISDFDFIGFTLQYELSYSNMLNMLKLGNVPVFRAMFMSISAVRKNFIHLLPGIVLYSMTFSLLMLVAVNFMFMVFTGGIMLYLTVIMNLKSKAEN